MTAEEVHARDTLPVMDSVVAAARRVGLSLATHDHETFAKVLALGAAGGSSEHLCAFRDFLTRPEAEVSTGGL